MQDLWKWGRIVLVHWNTAIFIICYHFCKNSTLGFHWTMNLAMTSMRTYFFSTSQEFAKWLDSSKIRDLYLMNWPYKMLQNLSYFWNKKTYIQLFSVCGTFPPIRPDFGKFWSISLGPRHIIKHKLLITEEWLGGFYIFVNCWRI